MRKCSECGKNYTSRSSLWLHRRLNHADAGDNFSSQAAPYSFKHHARGDQDDSERQFPTYEPSLKSDSGESEESIENEFGGEGAPDTLSEASTIEDEEDENTDVFGHVDSESEFADLTSDGEDSYSESEYNYDSDEEVGMPEEGQQEVFLRWPITKSYRVSLPWSYWGSEPKIKKCRGWIKRIYEKENTTIIYNVKRALDVEIATLCEIAYNCLHHQVPIEKNNLITLRKHRRALRCLANPNNDLQEKRECILLNGADFVNSIILCIHPLIVNKILSTINVPKGNTDEEEEEEAEYDHEYEN